MGPDGGELSRLLAPVTPVQFLRRWWGRRSLLLTGHADRFAELAFDLPTLVAAIAPRLQPGLLEVRLLENGGRFAPASALPATYTPASGLTLQAFRICDRLERLASFCAGIKLGLSLTGPVTMTGYSVPAGMGFRVHFDCQPNFILQISGRKRWRFGRTPAFPWPPLNVASAATAAELKASFRSRAPEYPPDLARLEEQVLGPGDLLYIPAGTWHQTESIDDSVSLTMTCIPRTAVDLTSGALADALGTLDGWREAVPVVLPDRLRPGRLPATVERFLATRLSELRKTVARLRPEDLYASWVRSASTLESAVGRVAETDTTPLRPDDMLLVSSEAPFRFVVDRKTDRIACFYVDRQLELAMVALPLVEAVARRRPFRARRAVAWLGPGYRFDDVTPVLAELVRAGILRRR